MCALFLPFTPNGRSVELLAIEVKNRLSLGPTALVDPISVLERVPARLIDTQALWNEDPQIARVLFVNCAAHWSGIGFGTSPDDGASLILLNGSQAPTRQRATLMEEIIHIVLDHPKTRITLTRRGLATRSHNSKVEDEAFNVGAACLLPYPDLFHAVYHDHETAAVIASHHHLSVKYVEFRINRSGLFAVYKKHVDPVGWRSRRASQDG